MKARTGQVLLGAVVAVLAGPAAARAADTVYATTGTKLLRFTTASTTPVGAPLTIANLNAGESVRSIDVRPSTGVLYGLTTDDRVVTIDPRTGLATVIGSPGATPDVRHGIDFNPIADRIRVVTAGGDSYRLLPEDGLVVGNDTDLSAGAVVGGVAYDRNQPGGTATTLFGIDSASDALVRIGGVDGTPSPNGGATTQIGPLGVDVTVDAGFDISPIDGRAFASLSVGGSVGFYRIDLATGAASPMGGLPADVTDIAVAEPRLTIWSAFNGAGTQILGRSYSDVPKVQPTPDNAVVVQGLQVGESITGLDQRPATGDLLALTTQSRVYSIDLPTGVATAIGSPLNPPVGPSLVGFDVDPVLDRVRVITGAGGNRLVHPDTGAVSAESPLTLGGSTAINVTGSAFTNSFAGAASTRLFGIGAGADQLLTEGPGGVLTPLGNDLRQANAPGNPVVDVQLANGFDIAPAGGSGLLLTRDGAAGDANLYRVVLTANPATTARLTFVGGTGGNTDPDGMAVMSPGSIGTGPVTAAEGTPVVRVPIVRIGATGPANVEYTTVDGTAKAGQDYTTVKGVATFADGEKIKLVDVPVADDTADEPDETFSLQLSGAGDGAMIGPVSSGTVTIAANDAPAPQPTQTVTVPGPTVTVPGPATTVTTPGTGTGTGNGPGTGTGTGSGTGTAKDTTKPLAFLVPSAPQTLRGIASKGFKLQLLSGEPAAATLTLRVDAATKKKLKLKSTTIGTGRATFTAAGVKTLSVKLSPPAAKAVKKAKKAARVTVDAVLTDTAGNRTTTTTKATLARR